jgi:adenylate cyclase
MAADVAGFSGAMERDEEGTFAQVQELRQKIIEPKIGEHTGRLVKTTGDGFLAEFASPIAAMRCAMAIQAELTGAPLRLRIGLNLGDVIVEANGDVYGEGVNVAARLEALADPGGILISGKVHSEVEGKIEAAFEDRGEQQVKNIARPVRVYAARLASDRATSTSAAINHVNPLPLPDKPSIAVLPFQNMSGNAEQEYFADGVVEDIITALSRFKSLFVIARNSSFTYKGKTINVREVGRELGVRYVLEGSVRNASGRVRVTGQLIEAATNRHLWADKFDGRLEDIFELQDQVAARVVGAVAPNVESAELLRTHSKATENLGAYDCFLRGRETLRSFSRKGTADALESFRRAIALDPAYARAYGWAARCLHNRRSYAWSDDEQQEIVEGARLSERAVALGSTDAEALTPAANFLGFISHRLEFAENVIDQALSLNPNLADAWRVRGLINIWLGRPDAAVDQLEAARRLSPIGPDLFSIYTASGQAYLYSGHPEAALAWLGKALVLQPYWVGALRSSIVAYVALGRLEDARNAAGELLKIGPELTVSHMARMLPFRRQNDIDLNLAAYRAVGFPE